MSKAILADPYQNVSGAVNVAAGKGGVLYRRGTNQFRRDWVLPTNPDTPQQQLVRAIQTAIAIAWQSVTDAEYDGWLLLAANLTTANPFGTAEPFSAQSAYTSVNTYRQLDGQAITDTAPGWGPFFNVDPNSLVYQASGDALDITFDNTTANAGFIYWRFTPVLPGLRRQGRKNELRTATADFDESFQTIAAGSNNITLTTTRLGTLPTPPFRTGLETVWLTPSYVPYLRAFTPSQEWVAP